MGRGQIVLFSWMSKNSALIICIAGLLTVNSCTGKPVEVDGLDWDYSSIESVLKKPDLKVLDIGNSYTEGATSLLSYVVDKTKADVNDMCLFTITRAGASFKKWCDVYNDTDNVAYTLRRVIGGVRIPLSSNKAEAGDGSLFRKVLSDVEWDIIIIHQVSNYAPYYEQWSGSGDGGYLDNLLTIIKKHQPKAQIGFLLVHSYWDGFSSNKEHSSLDRWKKIADSAHRLQEEYDIKFIIPYGTAVENLRASSLNNEYDLTRDGSHCGYGLCQYAAACCYYESLIAPRTGVSCLGIPAQIDVSQKESKYPGVNVTESKALIAQKAALLAIEDMFNCNNPED